MNGHCGRYDLSVKCTLKSKQSQPSPPTLATESYSYALTGRVECLSANHPPVAPLPLQAYRDTARSLGYPLTVESLMCVILCFFYLDAHYVCYTMLFLSRCTSCVLYYAFSISMHITYVILCLFSALSRRVGALQISIIIIFTGKPVRVTIVDSGVCCCVCVTSFER